MSFITTTTMTELDAVNLLLAGIQAPPVSTLINNTDTEVAQAMNKLSHVNREVQSRGWHFNTDSNVTLPLDDNNRIPLATNIMSMYSIGADVSMRGRSGAMFAYDKVNATFTFTASVTNVELIYLLDFVDLPMLARSYIAIRAVREFQHEILGQPSAEAVNSRDEAKAKAALIDDESRKMGLNMGWATTSLREMTKGYRRLNI